MSAITCLCHYKINFQVSAEKAWVTPGDPTLGRQRSAGFWRLWCKPTLELWTAWFVLGSKLGSVRLVSSEGLLSSTKPGKNVCLKAEQEPIP